MIIHTHPSDITIKHGGSFRIVCYGDVHYGAAGCNVKRFEESVLEKYADDESVYFLNLGDTFDCITPKDYRHRLHEIAEEFRACEDIVDKQVEGFADLWNKYKIAPERLLGTAHGNHEDSILKYHGSNPTERFCYLTKQRNLGYSFFLRLRVRRGTAKFPLVIFGSHGFAGGRMAGASVNTYTNFAFRHPGADIYLFGHNHRKWSQRVATISPNWLAHEQSDKSIIVGNTGTYMMTNGTTSAPSYSERAGMYPVELGHLELVVTNLATNRKGKQRSWLDIRVVE